MDWVRNFLYPPRMPLINGDYKGTAWSGFVIVATEDNTTVTVELNDDLLYFVPHPATVTIKSECRTNLCFQELYQHWPTGISTE